MNFKFHLVETVVEVICKSTVKIVSYGKQKKVERTKTGGSLNNSLWEADGGQKLEKSKALKTVYGK